MTRYLYTALFLAFSAAARAQTPIIIDRNDMPNLNDTLRVSQAAGLSGPPLTQTGFNQTWNYAGLRPLLQTVEGYHSLAGFPSIFQLLFVSPLSPHRATIATHQELPFVPTGLDVANTYAFFNESAADYRQVGFGATLNGQWVPAVYQSAQLQDVLYRFPLAFLQKDSSNSALTVNLPNTAALHQKRKRVNVVDGAGTLITPFGTFEALRVVSTLTGRDSLAVNGVPGPGIERPLTREYKWLGKSQGLPLLQVTTQVLGGQEVVTQVRYRDIYRPFRNPLGTAAALPEAAVTVYPNPADATAPLRLTLPAAGRVTVTATDLAGRRLFERELLAVSPTISLPAEVFGPFRGVVLLRVQTAAGVAVRRVVRH
ncbi:T9SS type A sorting domain-containing protein [Hymenobacter lucidus]|uniref:T9SS type A sorting domain-containing protein n=1 Tax=Hymenobacter lucidus TaxID=2880930 RepID=A0ABS8AQ87_9BACT|nr:T9SS type A sorting domain-containing protein [Hymenobacter lucidus]MCB2407574.1 T9SS type A sorting domain-containing protein [Hymenobacter lucidus]